MSLAGKCRAMQMSPFSPARWKKAGWAQPSTSGGIERRQRISVAAASSRRLPRAPAQASSRKKVEPRATVHWATLTHDLIFFSSSALASNFSFFRLYFFSLAASFASSVALNLAASSRFRAATTEGLFCALALAALVVVFSRRGFDSTLPLLLSTPLTSSLAKLWFAPLPLAGRGIFDGLLLFLLQICRANTPKRRFCRRLARI